MNLSRQWEIINEARRYVPVDLRRLSSNLGVRVTSAFLHPMISGMLERDRTDTFTVTLNHADSYTRQRFTLAHELGHFMLHRHLVGDGIDDDRAYRSTEVGKYHNTKIGPSEETEANQFAANLLMPRDMIEAEWEKRKDVKSMAQYFQVSEHAMSIRLNVPYAK